MVASLPFRIYFIKTQVDWLQFQYFTHVFAIYNLFDEINSIVETDHQ